MFGRGGGAIVQRIGHRPSKSTMLVRFQLRLPLTKMEVYVRFTEENPGGLYGALKVLFLCTRVNFGLCLGERLSTTEPIYELEFEDELREKVDVGEFIIKLKTYLT